MTGNSAENSSASKRNPMAREVRSLKYRARVVRSKKAYKRISMNRKELSHD
jgi:hypothetical protein